MIYYELRLLSTLCAGETPETMGRRGGGASLTPCEFVEVAHLR